MVKNPYVYGKFNKVKIAFSTNKEKGSQYFLSACHITEYSRLITDWLIIVQYLEIERGIPDC